LRGRWLSLTPSSHVRGVLYALSVSLVRLLQPYRWPTSVVHLRASASTSRSAPTARQFCSARRRYTRAKSTDGTSHEKGGRSYECAGRGHNHEFCAFTLTRQHPQEPFLVTSSGPVALPGEAAESKVMAPFRSRACSSPCASTWWSVQDRFAKGQVVGVIRVSVPFTLYILPRRMRASQSATALHSASLRTLIARGLSSWGHTRGDVVLAASILHWRNRGRISTDLNRCIHIHA